MKEEVPNFVIVWENEHFDAYSKAERPLNSNKKNKTTTSAICDMWLTWTSGTMLNVPTEENYSKLGLTFVGNFLKINSDWASFCA